MKFFKIISMILFLSSTVFAKDSDFKEPEALGVIGSYVCTLSGYKGEYIGRGDGYHKALSDANTQCSNQRDFCTQRDVNCIVTQKREGVIENGYFCIREYSGNGDHLPRIWGYGYGESLEETQLITMMVCGNTISQPGCSNREAINCNKVSNEIIEG